MTDSLHGVEVEVTAAGSWQAPVGYRGTIVRAAHPSEADRAWVVSFPDIGADPDIPFNGLQIVADDALRVVAV